MPFLNGSYSKIDRDYVAANFSKFIPGTNRLSVNWMVLNKHDSLKKYWEERIEMELPEGAEVWFKAEKVNEIYKYPKNETDTTY